MKSQLSKDQQKRATDLKEMEKRKQEKKEEDVMECKV